MRSGDLAGYDTSENGWPQLLRPPQLAPSVTLVRVHAPVLPVACYIGAAKAFLRLVNALPVNRQGERK